jgi:hypothetical protein
MQIFIITAFIASNYFRSDEGRQWSRVSEEKKGNHASIGQGITSKGKRSILNGMVHSFGAYKNRKQHRLITQKNLRRLERRSLMP